MYRGVSDGTKRTEGAPIGFVLLVILVILTYVNFSNAKVFALLSGVCIVIVCYIISCYFTGSSSPFALAMKPSVSDVAETADIEPIKNSVGHGVVQGPPGSVRLVSITSNNKISLSKLQTLIYFLIALFTYVYVFSLRYASGYASPLPRFSPEVLVLIGLSVTTTAGAQAISLGYQKNSLESEADKSDLIKNRDGVADLTKVQMLLWTLVSAVIYMITLFNLSYAGCYTLDSPRDNKEPSKICATVWNNYENKKMDELPADKASVAQWKSLGPLLPNFDAMLLILAGVVQGTYLSGRFFVSRNQPKIDGAYMQRSGNHLILRLVGVFDGIELFESDHSNKVPFKLYNFMLEITDNAVGSPILLNFKDTATIINKGNTNLDSTAEDVKVFGTNILITDALPEGEYTLRISVDGVWSEPKSVKLKV